MYRSSDLSFYIIALGCSKNLVDAEKLKGRLVSVSFNEAETAEEADIIVILTCGFITAAKEESINTIFEAINAVKERIGSGGFHPALAVAGCLTKRYFAEIKKEIPEINFLYGIPDEHFVSSLASELNIKLSGREQEHQLPLINRQSYRYIKIADGCSNNCSYCAIPMIRGPLVCYPPALIYEDMRAAAADGVKELVLIAQDTAAYKHGSINVAALLQEAAKTDGIEWVRLLYCHPDHIADELVEAIAKIKKVVKYLDIPFQHVSKKLLASMGRQGDYDVYLNLINKLRENIPDIIIRSTFMMGYPQETAADFNLLLQFLEAAQLDKVGAFVYSPEEGTRAFHMSEQVAGRTAKLRYNKLMKAQQKISSAKLQDRIGAATEVLVEERISESEYMGRTPADAPEVDGVFYLTSKRKIKPNDIVKARITGSLEYDLIGEQIEVS